MREAVKHRPQHTQRKGRRPRTAPPGKRGPPARRRPSGRCRPSRAGSSSSSTCRSRSSHSRCTSCRWLSEPPETIGGLQSHGATWVRGPAHRQGRHRICTGRRKNDFAAPSVLVPAMICIRLDRDRMRTRALRRRTATSADTERNRTHLPSQASRAYGPHGDANAAESMTCPDYRGRAAAAIRQTP